MTEPLDKILSGEGEATPSPEATEQPAVVAAEATDTAEPSEGESSGQAMVPKAALDEARGKAKRYTEQVASFETTVGELKQQNTGLARQVSELVASLQRNQPQQESPDFFSNPEAAVQQFMRPMMQRIEGMSEAMSRQFAVRDHGNETITQAYKAMEQRIDRDPAARSDYQRIMQSGDPWGELVRWHKRESVMAEIGTDPDAYREKIKAELMAEIQKTEPAQAATVMPSNFAGARNVGARTGPAWAGPKPLSDIFKR